MNIFAELIHAVYDFKSYTIFRKNGGGRTFLYALLLNGIYFILSLVLPVMATFFLMGGFLGAAKEVVPDFQLKDGKLWVDETYDIQEYSTSYGGVLLKIDTGKPLTEEITDVDLLAFDQAIVMDAEHMIVKAEGSSPIRVSYAEMDLGDWSRETFLRKFMPLVPVLLWFGLVFIVCFGLLGFFVSALVVTGIGSLIAAFMGCRLKFGEMYKLAVYARTPALTVECVYAWLPFVIHYFYIISYGISAVYMWKALQKIREAELEAPKTGWTGGNGGM
ncbi:MAG: DUF1189 domain-containing protein [Lachnospiraceae bacterium]|jgi:Protein of unknown function (DUF1189).|nr:DUF1189 domain-containing protein [Lachnospiraceae bacterium]MCI9657291.1 DUF1189 domain-containing protein [Lachnospiraceae bacterium]